MAFSRKSFNCWTSEFSLCFELNLTCDRHGIVVDLISTSEVHISMALNPCVTDESLEDAVYDLRQYGAVSL